ncbi:6163_t:CDS:2, partial [Gigaspora rosea]
VSDIVNQTLAIFKIIILLIISVIGLTKLKLNTNLFNWNNIFNASFDFGAYVRGLIKVLLAYEVVGYPNNSTDNESTPMPMRFGKELFGENGENFIAILVAISTFGCVISPSDGSFDYLISYCISWVAVALGLIFWYVRNQWQANRELIQNQGSNNETETIDETDRDEGSNDEE